MASRNYYSVAIGLDLGKTSPRQISHGGLTGTRLASAVLVDIFAEIREHRGSTLNLFFHICFWTYFRIN